MEENSHIGVVCITTDNTITIYDERGLFFMFNKKDNEANFEIGDVVIFNTFKFSDTLNTEMPDQHVYHVNNPMFKIRTTAEAGRAYYGPYFLIYGKYCKKHCKNGRKEWADSPFMTTKKETLLIKNILNNHPSIDCYNQNYFAKLYSECDSYIKGLDIQEIFGSLKIETFDTHIKKLGDDDSYYVWERTSINTKDPYIKSLFPIGDKLLYSETAFIPWHRLKEEAGYKDGDFGIQEKDIQKAIKKAKKSYSYSSHHQFLLSLKLDEIAKIKKQESELILQLSQDWPTPRYTELLRRQNNMENFIELYNSVISQPGNNVLVKYNLCTYKELNSDESFDTTFDDEFEDDFDDLFL